MAVNLAELDEAMREVYGPGIKKALENQARYMPMPSLRLKAKDLLPGDHVEFYGYVEWVEVYDGAPNVLVDFNGMRRGTYLAKSMNLRVVRR